MLDFSIYDLNFNPITNFWQYDYGVSIIVDKFNDNITEFHFANQFIDKAIVVKPQILSDKYVVSVPDDLLKQLYSITIYAYCLDNNRPQNTL